MRLAFAELQSQCRAYQCMGSDTVRYVGDIVAVVVAETPHQAYDALELIGVDYEPLPSVTDAHSQRRQARRTTSSNTRNEAFHWTSRAETSMRLQECRNRGKERIVQQRLIANAMEPRSALAQWSGASGELTFWNTTQNPHTRSLPHFRRDRCSEDKLRVIAPEVGGGFGSKVPCIQRISYLFLCNDAECPVNGPETRSENYQATTHGRDHVQEEIELAARKDGTILGLRPTIWRTWARTSRQRLQESQRFFTASCSPGLQPAGGQRGCPRDLHQYHAS